MSEPDNTISVDNYGEVLAAINDMELVSFEEDGGYQGDYLAVLKDDDRLFYYIDSYGSCSGCDWLDDVGRYPPTDGKTYSVPYKEALDYCADVKPKYIVPATQPLKMKNLGEYSGFKVEA